MIAPSFSVEVKSTNVTLQFEQLPAALRNRLRDKLIILTNELLAQVKAGEPRRTGRLQSMTRSYVDAREGWVRGRVRVLRSVDENTAAKAGALEYGAPGRRGRFTVQAHKMRLSHFMKTPIRQRWVMVPAYRRTAQIRELRFLRNPAAAMLPRARVELEQAVAQAIQDTMKQEKIMSDTIEPLVATPGTFNILKADQLVGKVKFVGANAIGPQITMEFTNVMFRSANAAHGLIQDEWGSLQVTGEVLVDATGIFGTVTHPDTTLTSPLTSLYYVGKGIVSVQILQGITPPDSAYRDIGNVPVFEFVPNITVLTHYSSRLGVRSKDLEVIHEKQATLNMHLDEWSYKNMQLALLGAP